MFLKLAKLIHVLIFYGIVPTSMKKLEENWRKIGGKLVENWRKTGQKLEENGRLALLLTGKFLSKEAESVDEWLQPE